MILFLDRNVCIKIVNAMRCGGKFDDELNSWRIYNRPTTVIFGLLSFLEGGMRKANYQEGLAETLSEEVHYLKAYFDQACTDIDSFESLLPKREALGIGQDDFQLNSQIVLHEALIGIIGSTPPSNKRHEVQEKILELASQNGIFFLLSFSCNCISYAISKRSPSTKAT